MIGIADKCLALVFSLLILGQAYVVRRRVGTWVFPACLFGLFWFAYTFVPLVGLFSVPVEPAAIAYIFVCTLVFSLGALPFDWRTAYACNALKNGAPSAIYGSTFLQLVFVSTTVAAIVFLVLNLAIQGISLQDVVTDLFGTVAAYADLLYSESLADNLFERMTLPCAYLGAILGGFLYASAVTAGRRRLILATAFLPALLVALTQSGKGLLFLSIVFFYASVLAHRVAGGTLRLFRPGTLKAALVYGPILAAVVTLAFVSRAGLYSVGEDDVAMRRLGAYFASYAFGHLYAFSDWFAFTIGHDAQLAYSSEEAGLGFFTFMGVFKMLGSDKVVPLGVYDEYTYADLLITNIYTVFRGLIQDFGFAGALLFMLATGLLLHRAFEAMLVNRRPVFAVATFVFMMGYFYASFIISALGWNRFLIAFALFWFVLAINDLLVVQRKAPGTVDHAPDRVPAAGRS